MKYFWAIFSIYIVVLSTIPCGDSGECNETACIEEATCKDSACSDESACNSAEDCTDEACSPFCVCSCCGCAGFSFDPFSPVTVPFNQSTNTSVIPYNSQFLSEFIANIWQPPKLS